MRDGLRLFRTCGCCICRPDLHKRREDARRAQSDLAQELDRQGIPHNLTEKEQA